MRKELVTRFRKRLLAKQEELTATLGRSVDDGRVGDDATKDLGDQASAAYAREFLFGLGSGESRMLRDVVEALEKIDGGAFGDCERCGEAIGEKRLEALPFARHCVVCQRAVETEGDGEA